MHYDIITSNVFDVPDRITGREGAIEISLLYPNVIVNFIEVNVTLNEYEECKDYVAKGTISTYIKRFSVKKFLYH